MWSWARWAPATSILVVAAVACEVAETTSDNTTSDGGTQTGQGGTPSVASSITSVGVGGAAGNPNLACFGAYTTVPMGECDLLKQNCNFGQGCEAVPGGNGYTTACVASTGLKGPGDACVNDNSCRAGLYCVFNKCSPICCPSSNEPCGVGGLCNVNNPFGSYTAQTCSYLESCTLFVDDCGADANCYPLMDDGNSVCAPLTGATVGEGQSCDSINSCDEWMVCQGNTCRWACFLDGVSLAPGAGGCPNPQTCNPTGANPPQNIGVCG